VTLLPDSFTGLVPFTVKSIYPSVCDADKENQSTVQVGTIKISGVILIFLQSHVTRQQNHFSAYSKTVSAFGINYVLYFGFIFVC